MRSLIPVWVALLLLCGCGDPAPDPGRDAASKRGPFDGTVTFAIPDGTGPGVLSKVTTTFLVVEKPGRKPLVDVWEAAKGSQYGRHRFPPGTSPAAVAGYYEGLLAKAGWKLNTDYLVADGSIHVFDVRALDAGTENAELAVTISPQR